MAVHFTRYVLGSLLRYARQRCKVSSQEFCKATGLGYKGLWDIERGIKHISIKKLMDFIAILGISEEEFWDMATTYLVKVRKDKKKKKKVSMYEDDLMDDRHKN